jgi:hypothetical protein
VRKGNAVERFGSIRFDGTLGPAERESAARVLSSAGVAVTSWNAARSSPRTYASLRLPERFDVAAGPPELPPIRVPAPLVLEFAGPAGAARTWLRDALLGPGRPAGILDGVEFENDFLLEVDERKTPLRTVLDVIRLEAGERIEVVPLLGLTDATLTGFAAATLGIAGLEVAALLETHSEPLLEQTR